MTREDEELVAMCQGAGQRQAFDELVRRHTGAVYSLVSQMVLDPAAADDLTQEVFWRAYRGIGKFNRRSQFSTWLYRVTMNTIHTHLQRQSRSPLEYHDNLSHRPNPAAGEPAEDFLQSEFEDRVRAALLQLSPKLRAAIVLTSIHRLGAKEAARIESCTVATMYWRIHEARRLLKVRLQDYLES